MGLDVVVEIDKGKVGGTFTNFDIISGVVKLTTTNALSLSYIQVKLEGVAKTELLIPPRERDDRRNRNKKDELRLDVHKVLYDTVIVFPPENVRSVATSKDFTLLPGTYTYDFSFKIPLSSSCAKVTGISNKIQFNKNNLVINNGNMSMALLRNAANSFLQPASGPQIQPNQGYHTESQLPPSLSMKDEVATVRYFVKVTCKRPSILKTNLRAVDPFNFLPLDMEDYNTSFREGQQFEEYKERFFRKDLVFKNRLPDVVGVKVPQKSLPQPPDPPRKSSFLGSLLGGSPRTSPSMPSRSSFSGSSPGVGYTDVRFAFEMRLPHPVCLSPTAPPNFKLYLACDIDPAQFSLAKYGKPDQTNGLGKVYLQSLKFDLKATTYLSVLDTDGVYKEIHQSKIEEVFSLCNNSYKNLEFDLMNCKRQKSTSATSSSYIEANSYELAIPLKYYENFEIPRRLAPSFHTCNITRTYALVVTAGITSDRSSSTDSRQSTQYVELVCPDIRLLSGLKITSTLHSNASGTSLSKPQDQRRDSLNKMFSNNLSLNDRKPPLDQHPSAGSLPSDSMVSSVSVDGPSQLPTYDDVVRERSFQDDSVHQRARLRYDNSNGQI